MFCIRCGTHLPDDAAFCPACGVPVTQAPAGGAAGAASAAAPEGAVPAPAPGTSAAPESTPGMPAAPEASPAAPRYGGFWRRFWGFALDRLILGVVFMPLGLLVLAPLAGYDPETWADADSAAGLLAPMMGAILLVTFISLAGTWLYNALLQSSSRQATLGQMALGLRVTDDAGRRISFGRATGRHFATLLTALTFGLGYLVMLFTSRRQTLHDLIAGTLVVR